MYKIVYDGNRIIDIISGSIKYKINAASEFEITLLAQSIDWKNVLYREVKVYYKDMLLISGFVDKPAKLKISDREVIEVSLNCVDNLGLLYNTRPKVDAHYQDQQVIGIIGSLLSGVPWEISLQNYIKPLETTTVDLRNKESLFGQLTAVVNSVPKLYYRYGGFNQVTSKHILELGYFNTEKYNAIAGANLLDISLEYTNNRVIKEIEAFGDMANDTRVTLKDAFYSTQYAADADKNLFPITQEADDAWVVKNASLSVGASTRKSFNINKTKNDEAPTIAEKREAGYGLWRNAVRELRKSVNYENFNLTALFNFVPKVGEKMFIQASVKEPIFDTIGQNIITYKETFNVKDTYKIVDITHNFIAYHDDLLEFDFSLTSAEEIDDRDTEVELFQKLERYDEFDSQSGVLFPIKVVSVRHYNVPADCNYTSGTLGKLFTFTTTVPSGATTISAIYQTNKPEYTAKIVTLPTISTPTLVLCVKGTSNWTTADDVTVTAYFVFT